jgi:hypothetical protein
VACTPLLIPRPTDRIENPSGEFETITGYRSLKPMKMLAPARSAPNRILP